MLDDTDRFSGVPCQLNGLGHLLSSFKLFSYTFSCDVSVSAFKTARFKSFGITEDDNSANSLAFTVDLESSEVGSDMLSLNRAPFPCFEAFNRLATRSSSNRRKISEDGTFSRPCLALYAANRILERRICDSYKIS